MQSTILFNARFTKAGIRSYTWNVDVDSGASYKYPAIRHRSHQHHFLERNGDLIVESFLQ